MMQKIFVQTNLITNMEDEFNNTAPKSVKKSLISPKISPKLEINYDKKAENLS